MNLFDPSPRSALEFLPPRHDLSSLKRRPQAARDAIYINMQPRLFSAKAEPMPLFFWWANSPVIAKISKENHSLGLPANCWINAWSPRA